MRLSASMSQPMDLDRRAFLDGSRDISVRFYVCVTTWRASDMLLWRANWNEILLQQLLFPQGRGCKNGVSFYVQAKHRRYMAWFRKHKMKPKHVYVRLKMLSSIWLSLNFVKMDILTYTSQGRLCILPMWANGYPAWTIFNSDFLVYWQAWECLWNSRVKFAITVTSKWAW